MCGRYTLGLTKKSLEERYDADLQEQLLIPRYNVAPTQSVPILCQQSPGIISVAKWGLIPSWAKDASIAAKTINARAETLSEKPSFKQALTSKRCLIPMTGFYEWKLISGRKIPHFIHLNDAEIISAAGLYDDWQNASGLWVRTCTIITTEVNQLLSELHHRMPVFLPPKQEKTWIDPNADPQSLDALLRPYPDDHFSFHPVSQAVNKVGTDHAGLLDEHDPGPSYTQGSLFD